MISIDLLECVGVSAIGNQIAVRYILVQRVCAAVNLQYWGGGGGWDRGKRGNESPQDDSSISNQETSQGRAEEEGSVWFTQQKNNIHSTGIKG